MEFSARIAEAASTAIKTFNYSVTMCHRQVSSPSRDVQYRGMWPTDTQNILCNKYAKVLEEEEDISLAEANQGARAVLSKISAFRNSPELTERDDEAVVAGDLVVVLVRLLLVVMGPILPVLAMTIASPLLARVAWPRLLAVLPSKENALSKVIKGQEAEETIMRVEGWAIERLNELNSDALQASRKLDHAIALHEFGAQDDSSTLQLADCVLFREELRRRIEIVLEALYKRHQSYNRAEIVRNKIEDARNELAGKDGKDFWEGGTEILKRESTNPTFQDKEGRTCCGGWWPW